MLVPLCLGYNNRTANTNQLSLVNITITCSKPIHSSPFHTLAIKKRTFPIHKWAVLTDLLFAMIYNDESDYWSIHSWEGAIEPTNNGSWSWAWSFDLRNLDQLKTIDINASQWNDNGKWWSQSLGYWSLGIMVDYIQSIHSQNKMYIQCSQNKMSINQHFIIES